VNIYNPNYVFVVKLHFHFFGGDICIKR